MASALVMCVDSQRLQLPHALKFVNSLTAHITEKSSQMSGVYVVIDCKTFSVKVLGHVYFIEQKQKSVVHECKSFCKEADSEGGIVKSHSLLH